MKRLYYYPSGRNGKYDNPYSSNLKSCMQRYYYVYESDNKKPFGLQTFRMFLLSFFSDVFILSWVENVGEAKYGKVQELLVKSAIKVMRFRSKKIVWIFHNFHRHEGFSKRTIDMNMFLINHSSIVISHSREGARYINDISNGKAIYFCHPFKRITTDGSFININEVETIYDIFIWGNIYPYKGVIEFISSPIVQKSNISIYIIGQCSDGSMTQKIKDLCSQNIQFENRRATTEDIMFYSKRCHYVLFPYIGSSVSSSGALIDTIVLGGIPIGPQKGAFKDLEEEGVCFTYKNYEDLVRMVVEKKITVSEVNREKVIEENNWERFASDLYELLSKDA